MMLYIAHNIEDEYDLPFDIHVFSTLTAACEFVLENPSHRNTYNGSPSCPWYISAAVEGQEWDHTKWIWREE